MTGEVSIWRARLEATPQQLQELARLLSADERARAERFRHAQVRQRFIMARATLRRILADCLGCAPRELQFGYGPHGKPHLVGEQHAALTFNLAHSGNIAVFAVARGFVVGVDVEQVRPERAIDDLARRFFAVREWETLRRLPAAERVPAFFRCWSRKEAFIKAIGDGLTFPLDEFEVSLHPEHTAELLTIRGDAVAARRWSLHDVPAPAGYAAALAVEGTALIVERGMLEDASPGEPAA